MLIQFTAPPDSLPTNISAPSIPRLIIAAGILRYISTIGFFISISMITIAASPKQENISCLSAVSALSLYCITRPMPIRKPTSTPVNLSPFGKMKHSSIC